MSQTSPDLTIPGTEARRAQVSAAIRAGRAPENKWKLLDGKGEFAWIPKTALAVDGSYQRKLNSPRARKMAHEWSWARFGVLLVSQRPDKQYRVVDGQHRHAAGLLRSDLDALPCMVFQMATIAIEAETFWKVNSERRVVVVLEQFKAMVEAGDPTAIEAAELIRQSGREVSEARSTGPGWITCIGAILNCLRDAPDVMRRIWPLIVELCHGHVLHNQLVIGFFHAEKRLLDGTTLTDARIRRRIIKLGPDEFMKSIGKAAAFRGSRNDSVCAEGILALVNHGTRHRLRISD